MADKKAKPDWDAIEKDYRLGQKSMRSMADQYGVNVSNISRRAKKFEWVQDKSEEVRQRTRATLIAQHERNTPTKEDIEIAVQTNVAVVRGHQKRVKSELAIIEMLEGQLVHAAKNRSQIEDDIWEETKGSDDGKPDLKRRNAMLKAVALPSHSGVVRDLSIALKNLVGIERQAFNIDGQPPPDPGELLAKTAINLEEATRIYLDHLKG